MKRTLGLLAVVMVAVGCQSPNRGWVRSELPTHDREQAFAAAREVMSRHFELARANWARGVIRSEPQPFEGTPRGTLADLRGAGGKWRRVAVCEIDRAGLDMTARVSVLLEREATEQAAVTVGTGTEEEASEIPRSAPPVTRRNDDQVWVEAGFDDGMARRLVNEIREAVERTGPDDVPDIDEPRKAFEEGREFGSQEGL